MPLVLSTRVPSASCIGAFNHDCLDADCGICVVRVLKHPEHLSPIEVKERDFLTAMGADPDERLACQCRIKGDVTIKVEF